MSTRNNRDLDDLLDEGGGRIGSLYRRLSRSEPPRRLDRNVLAEASRAVHGHPRGPRWLLGIGTAAGVLLAAGISWRVNHDMDQQRTQQLETAPMTVPASPAPNADRPAPNVIQVEPREVAKPAPAPAHKDAAADSESAPPEPERNNAKTAQPVGTIIAPSAATSAAPTLRKAEQAKHKLDQDSVADPAEKQTAAANDFGSADMRERRDESEAMPQAAAPMRESDAESGVAEPSASAADGARMAEPVGAGRSAPRAAMSLDAVAAEIERIRHLLGNGRRDEARAALLRLRDQNPDLMLPADLRELAR